MRIKLILRRILSAFGKLINLRKPTFIEFDCIDLVIDDKPLFLFVWEVNNGYKIKLTPLGKIYNSPQGAAIAKFSKKIYSIEVEAHSWWRKSTEVITLKHLELNDVAAAELIKSFKPFSKLETKTYSFTEEKAISLKKPVQIVNHHNITVRKHNTYFKTHPVVNRQHLQFPHL